MIYACCDEQRRTAVEAHATLNGIDWLEVLDLDSPTDRLRQRVLIVRLLKPLPMPVVDNVVIRGGERIRNIEVEWVATASAPPGDPTTTLTERAFLTNLEDAAQILIVKVEAEGDFSRYVLHLQRGPDNEAPLADFDPMLSEVEFHFKVECPTDFDCQPVTTCVEDPPPLPDIDYLAKDYGSFRGLMLDRISQLVPGWRGGTAADLGVALAELMAYVGDHLSYWQDAVATEAYLETARRRTSLRRHALLVDYRMHDGCNARVWLHVKSLGGPVDLVEGTTFFTRARGAPGRIVPSSQAHSEALEQRPLVFEAMHDLTLRDEHNLLSFYTWGDDRCCLQKGALNATLRGHKPDLEPGDVLIFHEVRGPLTGELEDADPSHRHAVRLVAVNAQDGGAPLTDPLNGQQITEIAWHEADALPFPLCISSKTDEEHGSVIIHDVSQAFGNVVLADHGGTIASADVLGTVPQSHLEFPVDRDAKHCGGSAPLPLPPRFNPRLAQGPVAQAATTSKLEIVAGVSSSRRVSFDPDAPARDAMRWKMSEVVPQIDAESATGDNWTVRKDLLNCDGIDRCFVVETEHDGSARLRFGDDIHGMRPDSGTALQAVYRVGNGTIGNVGAGSIRHVLSNDARVSEVMNPMPAQGGREPESAAQVRRRAPRAFRTQERAVTPADYAAMSERDEAVQQGASSLRWTGSWHSVFITVDRFGGDDLNEAESARLRQHVEPFRMAGHDVRFNDPLFVSLEIDMLVCVEEDYFRSHVRRGLLDIFNSGLRPDGLKGIFHSDRFTFGQTVFLSPLYAAAREVAGVESVQVTRFQRQGQDDPKPLADGFMTFGRLEIPRLENDPSFPEHGVLRLELYGGQVMNELKGPSASCGCCAGVDTETPRRIENAPGLSQIGYRVGTHGYFKESLLSRLSSSEYPVLGQLGTRDDDDFTIALCDALSVTLDVLTFYQERIANENFLRTASETRSVLELSRLIGYVPSPGVAASTHLSFTLLETPGDTTVAAAPVTIPTGAKVQSVPGPDESPQIFETIEPVEARTDWNAMPVQRTVPWSPVFGDTDLFLDGVATRLEPGDAILIVGAHRFDNPGSERWDVRVLETVEPDLDNHRTHVTWKGGIGHVNPRIEPADEAVSVYAFRLRAALFGHNAPDPNLLSDSNDNNLDELVHTSTTLWKWKNYDIQSHQIDLDAAYPKVVAGSWVALVSNETGRGTASLPGYTELYRVKSVRQTSRADFGLSGRTTRIEPDVFENLSRMDLDKTLVLGQSERMATARPPLMYPLYGDNITLEHRVEGLVAGRALAVRGKRQRIVVAPGVTDLQIDLDDGSVTSLSEGDSLVMIGAPARLSGTSEIALTPTGFRTYLGTTTQLTLRVLDRDGGEGVLDARGNEIALAAAEKADDVVGEVVLIEAGPSSVTETRDHIVIDLATALKHVYERSSTTVNANVVRATHGETIKETLGNGDAGVPDQSFEKQSPVTFVSASTPSGRASTVGVRVNDLLWSEVPALYAEKPDARVVALAINEDGEGTVRFGDGVEGARPPSGQGNVRVAYRKGLGVGGNVAAGTLTSLLSRPLGVTAATNPEAATGGQDRESLSRARENAPVTVLTLDRAVSEKDYADFARAFAGISKAHSLWVPAGPARGVLLTVAGVDGAAVLEGSATHADLQEALRTYGDPLIPVRLVNYRPASFRTRLSVRIDQAYELEAVLEAVAEALQDAFSFDARSFGQGTSLDEVMAVAHEVDGVVAAHLTELFRPGPGVAPSVQPRLRAALPVPSLTTVPEAAELLTLSEPLVVEVLP